MAYIFLTAFVFLYCLFTIFVALTLIEERDKHIELSTWKKVLFNVLFILFSPFLFPLLFGIKVGLWMYKD